MKRLQEIGMQKNWIYEVIVSTYYAGTPHAAPMGIWTEDYDTLNMAIYKDSKTLENIMKEKEFTANFVDDVTLFYESLFSKDKIAFKRLKQINAPFIKDASAIIECKVKHIEEEENRFHISSEIIDIRIWDEIKLINRAEGLVIESLILATRLPHFPGRRNEDTLKENFRIIAKVAPNSMYEHTMKKVMDLFKFRLI